MHFSARLFAAAAAAVAIPFTGVMAKPEQIRGVSSPIFHYYLQSYPQDREFLPQFNSFLCFCL
jgi:hypothetical protein